MGEYSAVAIVVRRATVDDVDRSAAVLGLAFADYAWTRWTVDADDHVRRVTGLQRLALQAYGLAFGQVWLAVVDGVAESVAVWMDSAVDIPSDVHLRIADATAALAGTRSRASLDAESQLNDWRPRQRHLYLATVGTSPTMQRQGLAERTITPMLATADDERIAAFLETSSETNVAFYRRLGFVTVDHRVIAGGGPDVWAMLREPM
ncbi:MAG: GCN5-related N-acetyltransferase [Acidimicrobiales bacterium]|nr:GCN5-related N-acetyltransferase [Acidimicrobiales bacterium]